MTEQDVDKVSVNQSRIHLSKIRRKKERNRKNEKINEETWKLVSN